MSLLAHAHPAWMLASLALAALAFRAGLVLRRARQMKLRRNPEVLRRHLWMAKTAVSMILLGFLAGPISAYALRGWTPFQTAHAWVGLLAVVLFGAASFLGRKLERGRGRPLEAHALLAVAALLAGGLAFFTGFVLLP